VNKLKNKILIIGLLILTVLVFNIANAEATRTAVIGFGSEDSSWIVDRDKEQEILRRLNKQGEAPFLEAVSLTTITLSGWLINVSRR
jgi:hypothetical protein